jgi:hypothetical protein
VDPEYLPPAVKPRVPDGAPLDTRPREAQDVRAAFDALRIRPERLGSWDMDRFPHPAYLSQNTAGGETRTHFQGIQRLTNHPLLVVSGADKGNSVSHLFVVECRPRSAWGPLGSNLWTDRRSPPSHDRLRRIIGLDKARWHGGGISVLGDVVAVPIMGNGLAQVVFLDLSTPMVPRWAKQQTGITCRSESAGAAALTRGPNGQFLCAVWDDHEGGGWLDFYASTTAVAVSTHTPFEPMWAYLGRWNYAPPSAQMPKAPRYQGVSFIWEAGTGKLFMIGTRSGLFAPAVESEDWADLYQVGPPAGMAAGGAAGTTVPTPVYLTSRRFRGADEFCSFAAGGGAFVSETGALSLYGAFHFRGDGLFRMSEFWSHISPAATWWVDLYERSDFMGDRLGIFDPGEARIEDYRARFAQGAAFDETVHSARFRLPMGVRYRLYTDSRCPTNAPANKRLDLEGTGQVVEVPRLDALNPAFGSRVRSSAPVA